MGSPGALIVGDTHGATGDAKVAWRNGIGEDSGLDLRTYRKRCRIEQAVGWLKECRRLGTRFEKLGQAFLAFVKLGIMLRYLRKLAPSDTA